MIDTTASRILPVSGSTIAGEVDALFNFVFYASMFFLILVTALAVYFVIRYRRRADQKREKSPSHNTRLELAWTIIPAILVFIVFLWGFRTYLKMQIVPANALEVKVTGQKWFWSFDYPQGTTSMNELVVPADTPVKLTMSSTDVIHSFYVPGFRIKMDVLPNRYSITWFEAHRMGTYDLFCTEYCGTGHSEMIGKVRVVSQREYEEWLDSQSIDSEGMPLAELGAKLYQSKACATCHNVDGRPGIGPSFLGRFGTQIDLADGSRVEADENYMRESILNPQAKVAAGYQSVMPTYQGLLKDREIDALIEYIKSIQDDN